MSKSKISKKTILVSSGKGGVGKSTISAALSQQLALKGKKVGLIDSDLYCSSINTMFGIGQGDQQYKYGVHLLSLGYKTEQHVAWRGLIATKVLSSMIKTKEWQDFDYVIIDMPPGTADIHINIASNYEIAGAIIVSTNHQIAMHNAFKAGNLYKQYAIKTLGIAANMCTEINGVKELAQKLNADNVISIPFSSEVAKSCDLGQQIGSQMPDLTILLEDHNSK